MKLVRLHSIDTVWGSTGTTMLNCEVDFEIALPRYALKTLPFPPLSLFKILKAKRGGGPASVPPRTTSNVFKKNKMPPPDPPPTAPGSARPLGGPPQAQAYA